MKKLLRLLTIITTVAMFTSLFAGCGKQSTEEVSKDTAAKGPVKLVVWGAVPAENGPQKLVDEWNKNHTDVQVEYVRYVNDDTGNTKLDTALLSGEQIDVYFTYQPFTLVKRVEGGMAEDLTSYGIDSFLKDNLPSEGILKYKGKSYSIPTCKEPVAVMLNKSALDAQKITIPDKWTIDEYRQIAKQLTKTENGKKTYGTYPIYQVFPIDVARMILGPNYWYKDGGKESNFNNEAFKMNSLSYDLINTDKSAFPYEEILSRKLKDYPQNVFLDGEASMMVFSPWMLRYVNDTAKYPHDWITTFAPLPIPEKGEQYYNIGALNNYIMMNSKSQHKKEAYEFMKYWTTDGSKFLIPAGKVPIWNKASKDEIISGMLGSNPEKRFDVDAFKKVFLDSDIKYTVDDITVASPEMTQIYKEETDKLYLKQENYDTFLKNIKSRSDDAIKKAAK